MGLDLSLTATGLLVMEDLRVRRWRLLETEPVGQEGQSRGLLPSGMFRGHQDERIEWSVSHIRKAWRKFRPDLVVIEEYAFGARGRGLTGLHEHGGVVRNFLFRVEAPYVVVTNNVIKEYATGKGRASKKEMIQAAIDLWPAFPKDLKKNDNVADAYHLAHFGTTNYSSLLYNA